MLVPLFNGFPHTGALARTATNIKVGAVSPLAGVFKFALKLTAGRLPGAVAGNRADGLHRRHSDVRGGQHGQAGGGSRGVEPQPVPRRLMVYTAVMVPMTDFLIGVLSALALYGVLYRFLDTPVVERPHLASGPAGEPHQHRGMPIEREPLEKKRQAS